MPTLKTQTRTVAKKVPAKKAAPAKKSIAKKTFVYAADSESFWLSDGQILNSLVALKDALATMDKATYGHHVTSSKNDFAEWVLIVLGDAECAESLRVAKTPLIAKTAVTKHLKNYSI
jgi:hypothetical protein